MFASPHDVVSCRKATGGTGESRLVGVKRGEIKDDTNIYILLMTQKYLFIEFVGKGQVSGIP